MNRKDRRGFERRMDAFTTVLISLAEMMRQASTQLEAAGPNYSGPNIAGGICQKVDMLLPSNSVRKEVVEKLYGFSDGFLYSETGVAKVMGLDIKEVRKIEREWRENLVERITPFSVRRERWLIENPCACGAKSGAIHKFGCKHEECPFCHKLAWSCLCPYKKLGLGWGGRSAQEWRRLKKQHHPAWDSQPFDRTPHIRPLNNGEQREWGALIMKKGPIRYGDEVRFS